jgi:hypothetical protein
MIPSSPIWGKSGTKTSPHQNIQYLFIGFCILVAFQAASVSAYGAFPYTSQILGISGM